MNSNIAHTWEMHCHSDFSDGALSPQTLYDRALEQQLDHLVLTDHDTAAGFRWLTESGQLSDDLKLWSGAELSSIWQKRSIHVVGIGMDVFSDDWRAVEARYDHIREQRLERLLFVLRREGLSIDEQAVRDQAGEGTLGRPHIARHLVETGQAKNSAQAFKRWLGQGKVGDVKQNWPELERAVDDIRRCGGVAVLAHPHRYKLTWRKLDQLLTDFQLAGGQAVEVSCPAMPPELRKRLVDYCREQDLFIGGGSDFHLPDTPWARLGFYPQWPNDGQRLTDLLESGTLRVFSPDDRC
ncbi:PHP domain-containing protein [Saccharospirillum salsuginis]|uniref:Phosphatase n=1 Tax=Saccharospirillum salsuginis TaxID=418750 RepID=A0A918NE88_9GAMM|nr:PHP domain-containing protein [Saccharospirillum salsuginis]GGX60680.1 phosphatase [Saccharospirillum salsuginis]